VSKRDEDPDMEVGMTTAERRRRRRRGGGLRVPSDNVPRQRAQTAPPAPVPEDPSLAMSIAYSFTNDGSGPVARTAPEAPEEMPTVIDPPSAPVEHADFEMKTREMNAVDLKELGLEDPSAGSTLQTIPVQRVSAQNIVDAAPAVADAPWGDPNVIVTIPETKVETRATDPQQPTVDVDVDVTDDAEADVEPTVTKPPPLRDASAARAKTPSSPPPPRAHTVALTDEDLEDVRAATQPGTSHKSGPIQRPAQSIPPPIKPAQDAAAAPKPPVARVTPSEPISVSDIDIQELADRAEASGEIDVAVEAEVEDDEPEVVASPPPPARPSGRTSHASQPPPIKEATAVVQPAVERKSGAIEVPHPPPPPPGAHHHVTKPPPPTPPKTAPAATQSTAPAASPKPDAAAKSRAGVVAAVVTKEPSKPQARGKPWFVDLFDEDYLRTLPYLTPQATQAEAEYISNALALKPGAQVLDVGCGYGRHAMELAARGFHVVGLDLSTQLLVRGGEEAARRGLTINFVPGDMRELDFENQFDGAYCVFSTFGYFDDETNKKTLANIARALKPGGKVLLEILNRDYLISDLPTRVWWEGDGCVVLEEVELNYFSSRIQVNRSVVFDDGRQLEQEISVRAYSLHELGKLMHAANFRVLEVSGGYQTRGRFFGNQSRHIIVLAERKESVT
jgi:SAM-dependent methyltransferase